MMDALVHPRKEKGGGGWEGATSREPALATSLKGMFYADNAGVVSQSSEHQRKMMGVIAIVCRALGLHV